MTAVQRIGIVAVSFSLAALAGCSNITMLRTAELRAVKASVDSLDTRLGAQLAEFQQKQSELLRVIRADMELRFGELGRRIEALEMSISESQSKLSKIDQKTQEIRERWEERAKADSLMQTNSNLEVEKLFQVAFGDFTAGRHDLAIGGFTDILTRFPDSPMADEASYWIAECQYVKKDYENAEKGYIEYIKNRPQGVKICAALYKLGFTYEKMKKGKSQRMVWEKLIGQCPDSEEARAASAALR